MIVLVGATAGQNKHCTAAGGMLMTNLGAFDQRQLSTRLAARTSS